MPKIVQPETPEYALDRAIEAVGAKRIAAGIGKSEGLVYKLRDPDQEYNMIRVADAMVIDDMCAAQPKGFRPFAELLNAPRGAAAQPACASVKEQMLEAQAAFGTVASAMLKCLAASSEDGEGISARELNEVLPHIEQFKREVAEIEAALVAASRKQFMRGPSIGDAIRFAVTDIAVDLPAKGKGKRA